MTFFQWADDNRYCRDRNRKQNDLFREQKGRRKQSAAVALPFVEREREGEREGPGLEGGRGC